MNQVPSIEEIASWFGGDQVTKDLNEADHIVRAEYQTGDYSGDYYVEYVKDGTHYVVQGYHCSCYGPEWEPRAL